MYPLLLLCMDPPLTGSAPDNEFFIPRNENIVGQKAVPVNRNEANINRTETEVYTQPYIILTHDWSM